MDPVRTDTSLTERLRAARVADGLTPAALRDRFGPAGVSSEVSGRQSAFAAALGRARETGDGKSKAREAAEQLVATTFIQPILKRMRDSSQAAPPFAPTRAEKQFGSILDSTLAGRIVQKADWSLVDRIERDMNQRSGALAEAQASLRASEASGTAPAQFGLARGLLGSGVGDSR